MPNAYTKSVNIGYLVVGNTQEQETQFDTWEISDAITLLKDLLKENNEELDRVTRFSFVHADYSSGDTIAEFEPVINEDEYDDTLYIEDITGTIGAMLDKDWFDIPTGVIKLLRDAYEMAARELDRKG